MDVEEQKIKRLGYFIGYDLGKKDGKQGKICSPSQAFEEYTSLIQQRLVEPIKRGSFDYQDIEKWQNYCRDLLKKKSFKESFKQGYERGWDRMNETE